MLTEENHCFEVGRFLIVFLCNCHPIEALKHVAFNLSDLYTSYNSNFALYSNQILQVSLQNCNSTMDEHVRYLMHKYSIVNRDWRKILTVHVFQQCEFHYSRIICF